MTEDLAGQRIAVLATDGFEYAELAEPVAALQGAGAETVVVSKQGGLIRGYNHSVKVGLVAVQATLHDARPDDFNGLVLPGGVANPDALRMDREAVAFVSAFVQAGKPIAAICHAPWMLIEAGAVRGKRLTSWPSLKTDLTNAGAHWEDRAVVVDGRLVTSRNPGDIPVFNRQIIKSFAEAA